ncbi:hypothetical protein BRW64_00855 [Mycolicibacterium diernhoferi]|uniref:Uncharacterized protein n=2 Tax=Mycolicibacterium diernhoferi TaxID=1801 RepID=A0A1Q4HKY2_9MYCO|nr:hypothetical protein BRW64_00855 [Mycolicibacterium diernhoferi]OPE55756.1 hypothetical protein BV510_03425 [Mycolicibacterium diernhoferi]PEG56262.1 hypothetical protein CRI78_02535 [Mycolicibacterium diernhoferi]
MSGTNETLAGAVVAAIAGQAQVAAAEPVETQWDRLDRYHEAVAEIRRRNEQPDHEAPVGAADVLLRAIAGHGQATTVDTHPPRSGGVPSVGLNSDAVLRRALGI